MNKSLPWYLYLFYIQSRGNNNSFRLCLIFIYLASELFNFLIFIFVLCMNCENARNSLNKHIKITSAKYQVVWVHNYLLKHSCTKINKGIWNLSAYHSIPPSDWLSAAWSRLMRCDVVESRTSLENTLIRAAGCCLISGTSFYKFTC